MESFTNQEYEYTTRETAESTSALNASFDPELNAQGW